jgi:hypothetical protein
MLASPLPRSATPTIARKLLAAADVAPDGALAITEPNTETGMTDCQLDQVEGPQHHPGALARLTGPPKPAL